MFFMNALVKYRENNNIERALKQKSMGRVPNISTAFTTLSLYNPHDLVGRVVQDNCCTRLHCLTSAFLTAIAYRCGQEAGASVFLGM